MNDVAQLTGQTGQAAGQTAAAPADAAGQASSLLQQPMQLISGLTQPLQQLVSAPMQGIQGLTSMPQGLMSSMSGLLQSAGLRMPLLRLGPSPNPCWPAGRSGRPRRRVGGWRRWARWFPGRRTYQLHPPHQQFRARGRWQTR